MQEMQDGEAVKYWFMTYSRYTKSGRWILSQATKLHPMIKVQRFNEMSTRGESHALLWWKELTQEEVDVIEKEIGKPILDWESAG